MPIINNDDIEEIDFVVEDTEPANPEEGTLYFDDGTNRCNPPGDAGLRLYTGGAFYDISNTSCGSGSGATSLIIANGANQFTMASGTGYRWVKTGPVLTIQAYLQWTSIGTATTGLTISGFLPAVIPTSPAYQGGIMGSFTGIATTSADFIPKCRVAANTSVLTLLKANPNSGAGMQTLNGTDCAATGIMYISGSFILAS